MMDQLLASLLLVLLTANCRAAESLPPPHAPVVDETPTTDVKPSASVEAVTEPPLCGDGSVSPPESCDDGNTSAGDGCSSSCAWEPLHVFSPQVAEMHNHTLFCGRPDCADDSGLLIHPTGMRDMFYIGAEEGLRTLAGVLPQVPPMGLTGEIVSMSGRGTYCLVTSTNELWCGGPKGYTFCEGNYFEAETSADGGRWCKFARRANTPIEWLAGGAELGCYISLGEVYCWQGPYGPTPPKQIDIREPVSSLAVGRLHVCAMTETGRVVCWGDASFGQVGFVGEKKNDYSFDLEYGLQRFVQTRPRPVFLDLPAPAKQVYAAGFMSCAWLENDELWCWGDTSELHFRDSSGPEPYWDRMTSGYDTKNQPIYKPTFASTLPSSPLQMPDNCTPKDISVVVGAICVVCDSGCAQCWGGNGDNYLGYGDSKDSWAPRNECLDF